MKVDRSALRRALMVLATLFSLLAPLVASHNAAAAPLERRGSKLDFSTYFGGRFDDWINDVAVDEAGNAYVVGETWSYGVGSLGPPSEPCIGRSKDYCWGSAFVAKFSPSGELL